MNWLRGFVYRVLLVGLGSGCYINRYEVGCLQARIHFFFLFLFFFSLFGLASLVLLIGIVVVTFGDWIGDFISVLHFTFHQHVDFPQRLGAQISCCTRTLLLRQHFPDQLFSQISLSLSLSQCFVAWKVQNPRIQSFRRTLGSLGELDNEFCDGSN